MAVIEIILLLYEIWCICLQGSAEKLSARPPSQNFSKWPNTRFFYLLFGSTQVESRIYHNFSHTIGHKRQRISVLLLALTT